MKHREILSIPLPFAASSLKQIFQRGADAIFLGTTRLVWIELEAK